MTETPPQNPYPTPQTTRQRLKPALQLETPSRTRSPGSSDTLVSSPEQEEDLGAAFEAQDVVARFADPNLVLPIPKLVSLGAQSAGKSTLLSALLNITLWSAPEKSTFGATLINSRHTPGSFHAEIWIEYATPAHGVPKRVQFTLRAIEDKKQLELALKLAGDEARRSVDGMRKIRTYETLCGMSPEEQGHTDWPRFTVNTVVLHVRGPEQPDLTVVDLPGLIKEEECQLAELYVRDKNNMILYCVPGGTQPSDVTKETRLIKKYGPESGGVACVITKAHAIDYVHEDPHILLALGVNPDISLEASLGWYCVRLRRREEAGMSPQIVQMAEASLFAQPDWRAIQERRALTLGIAQTKSRLLEAFARRVKSNNPILRQYMEEQKSAVEECLSRLPPVVENPIGGAHDLIIEIAAQLEDTLYTQNEYTRRLLESQEAFTSQLNVPTFVATFKPEDTADSGLRVHLDDTLHVVRKNTSARTDAANLDRVRHELRQQRCVDWPDLCRAYIDNVWDITNQAVVTIVAEVCEERNATCAELPALLAASQKSFKNDALNLAQRLCQSELTTDPLQVSLPSPHVPVYAATRERLRKEFSEAFEIPPTSPTRESIVAAGTDSQFSWVERKRCLDVEATLATTLDRGRHRLADVVGRQAQIGVKEWCRQVVPSLRKDMGLEELEPKTRKRVREMFELDPQVAEERARCLRQLEVFRELQAKLPV